MSTIVKPKTPRGGLAKKNLPKSIDKAKRLTADEQQNEQTRHFNKTVKLYDAIRVAGELARTLSQAYVREGTAQVEVTGPSGDRLSARWVSLADVQLLPEQPSGSIYQSGDSPAAPAPSPANGNGKAKRKGKVAPEDCEHPIHELIGGGRRTIGQGVNGDPSAWRAALNSSPQPPAPSLSAPVQFDEVTDFRLDWLARHPLNRHPTLSDVEKIKQGFDLAGQLEPIVVRELEDERAGTHFQILSGETRWLAARALGWTTIAGRLVKDCDDALALALLARYNGERTDLDPIQRARLIEELCKPAAEGGAGHTREEAARAVGLESGSAASNLVRLLALPQVWQERVASGQLPESFARLLVPLAKAPKLLQHLEKEWAEHVEINQAEEAAGFDSNAFDNRASLLQTIENLIDWQTRPVDPGVKFRYTYPIPKGLDGVDYEQRQQPILFELTDELRAKLEIAEFTLTVGEGKKAKSVVQQRATNVELWDKLQVPLIKAKAAEAKKKGATSAAAKDEKKTAVKKALTPAQQKVKDKERAAQLAKRIDAWRHRWLCDLVARELPNYHDACNRLLVYVLASNAWKSHELAAAAYEGLGAPLKKSEFVSGDKVWKQLWAAEDVMRLPAEAALLAVAQFVMRRADSNPAMPLLRNVIDDLALGCQINLAAEWAALQDPDAGGDAEATFAAFLELHQVDQLDALGKEWGVFTEAAKGKAAKIKLLDPHGPVQRKPYPLAKSIRPLEEKPKAESGKRKKKS